MTTGSAYLVSGSREVVPHVLALIEKEGTPTHGNPDVYVREYARFGIDDARELRERAALRPAAGARRIFVICTPTLTADAQNALLKTLEEPPAGARFYFVVPSPHALLSTLRSRMQILTLQAAGDDGQVDVAKFLAATPEKRLELLKPLLQKDSDDKRDLRPIFSFLASLETALSDAPDGLQAACRLGLESVYRARKYLNDKGALLKPLLEQVALLVPRM